jgi:hypothetical protein
MTRFIDVTLDNGDPTVTISVNIRNICYFAPDDEKKGCEINFDPDWSIHVAESCDEVKTRIAIALGSTQERA